MEIGKRKEKEIHFDRQKLVLKDLQILKIEGQFHYQKRILKKLKF